ncbi:MAG: M23 family metallopeptidase [Clostridiaceae bacterium]|nr:M23 family metallopeptidase [Clostridiaceae bacterium]
MAEVINAKIPVLKKGYHRMTLPFGNQQLQGKDYLHKGIDLTGNPSVNDGYDYITAIAGGRVITAGYRSDSGYWVVIDHGNGVYSRYMHMKKGSLTVKVGDTVVKGQTLGYMGATGNVTGRHLHFDLSINGNVVSTYGGFYNVKQNRTYFDPLPYLKGSKTLPISSASSSSAPSKPSTGSYIVREAVNVRKGPGTNFDKVYYSQFTANAKSQVKKLDASRPNHFPAGVKTTIKQVKQAANGTWWGKCPSGWVCMNYLSKA